EALEDDIRKITKNMGFNIRILPKDQNLHDVYASGFADKTMPDDYADRLAKSRIVTIAHILPRLMQRVEWSEQKRSIVLIGVHGQVPQSLASAKKPIQPPVAQGTIVLGYELHHQLGLKE